MKDEEEFVIECSDEESYGGSFDAKGMWYPPTDDIIKLYDILDDKGVIELFWQCPGRRNPTPPPVKVNPQDKNPKAIALEQTPTAFDFDEYSGETSSGNTKITPRRTPGSGKLKGSGKKQVGSFKNVMSDIRRQIKLEQLDKHPPKSTKERKSSKSPKS